MAKTVLYIPNKKGMRQILNASEMCQLMTSYADEIASRANGMFNASGYGVKPGRPGKNRAHAIVYTGDKHTVNSNRVHNTLEKAKG